MRTVYIITRIITFFGAYLRGFWEHLTCKILALPVEVPGYLRLDEACSHVEHSLAKRGKIPYNRTREIMRRTRRLMEELQWHWI